MNAGKTDIWMPVYIGDYLADTMHLSTQQHGAYLLLLFHLWRRGSLPDDDGVLAKITGLERADWLAIRPAMAAFFQIGEGLWAHRRVERERARIDKIARVNFDRAQNASQKRWKKQKGGAAADAPDRAPDHASGNASSNPSSNAPEMLEDSQSQSQPQSHSQSQAKAETNLCAEVCPSRVSYETRGGDTRLHTFRALLASYWREKNPAFPEMPWHKKDFMALRAFLAACPQVTEAQFRQMLVNRARSPVPHGDRVYLWIGNVTRFQEEMTVYHRPVSAAGGSYGSSRAEINRDAVLASVDRAIAVVRASVDGPGETGAEPATVTDSRMLVDDGAGSGGCSVELPGARDYRVAEGDAADG